MAVYVTQYGGFWKLTKSQWATVVELGLSGKGYNLDDYAPMLKRRPRCIHKGRDAVFMVSNRHILVHPLDHDFEDWQKEKESL